MLTLRRRKFFIKESMTSEVIKGNTKISTIYFLNVFFLKPVQECQHYEDADI